MVEIADGVCPAGSGGRAPPVALDEVDEPQAAAVDDTMASRQTAVRRRQDGIAPSTLTSIGAKVSEAPGPRAVAGRPHTGCRLS
jgi:hypothetical protein